MARGLCGLGNGMSCAKWLLWALLGLIALYALMWFSQREPIEDDIQQRTTAALHDQGHNWAEVDLNRRGRDVLLKGAAPTPEARLSAIGLAEDVYGVRVVEDQTTELELTSASFGLSHQGDKIILSGAMPTQGHIDSTVNAASDAYGSQRLINRMNVDQGVRAPKWLDGVNALMPSMSKLREPSIQINDEASSFGGLAEDDSDKESLLSGASALFASGFSNSITVKPSGPSPEELARIAADKAKAEAERIALQQAKAYEAERLALEKAKAEEAARLAAEQAQAAKEARLAEEKAKAKAKADEAARLAAEQAKAEEARLAAEKAKAKEAARLAAEQAKAEEARLAAEKAKADEAARLAAEQAKAEEVRLAAEKAKAEEAARLAAEQAEAEEVARLEVERKAMISDCQNRLNNTMQAQSINFASASAAIDKSSYPLLKQIAAVVTECKGVITQQGGSIEVAGHTDSTGDEGLNLNLSNLRAEAVRDYLVKQGVSADMLIAKGYGELQPLVENSTPEGRAQNRRIQFDIKQ